jgi:hexosaminidase
MRLIILSCILAGIFFSCSHSLKRQDNIALIPKPQQLEFTGHKFKLKGKATIGYSDPQIEKIIPFLKSCLEEHGLTCETQLQKDTASLSESDIILMLDNTYDSIPEGYCMSINKSKIIISASDNRGLFYGIQTIRQLIQDASKKKIIIPTMKIIDYPRFSWRGMHLDVSRHFMPKVFIKKYIDYMAFLKMNTFHWHLVDDQGWRIEIKRYPELTRVGAWRDSTWAGHSDNGLGKYDRAHYGGYYTQDEIREIISYAKERFVTIVPEIEIPGHSQAAIAAYPELGCTPDTIGVMTKWGISPYIYNIDETTFTFLFSVLDEVIALFPSTYIHIGGDEALKDQWKASKKIQQQMHKLKIKNESDLQAYFTRKIEEYLTKKGRKAIGWDEVLEGNIPPETAIMSWRGTQGGIDAVKAGHKVVMTPTDYCYFDYYQSKDTTEPLTIGGYLPIDKVYSYDPVPSGLNSAEARLIMGTQGNVWTEYMDSPEKVEYMIFPRIFAMAEIQWIDPEKKDYGNFLKRLKLFEPFLNQNKINNSKHAFRE